VLQTSGFGVAEVVIFAVDKYQCILLGGRAAGSFTKFRIDMLIIFHGVLQLPQN
jgi:hypothetical protein